MANELSKDTQRVGDFVDFNPDTPEAKAVLEHSARGLEVTLSWSSDESPYASWFLQGSGIVRVPSRPETTTVPRRVLFEDSYGSVLLIGCHTRNYRSQIRGPGSGTLRASAAIMGVKCDLDFGEPHGLQTEISGLRSWLDKSSWDVDHRYEKRPFETVVRSVAVPDVEVGKVDGIRVSLEFTSGVKYEEDGNRIILSDDANCVTRSDLPMAWSVHMNIHHAVRDLLVLSRWTQESCIEVFASREDDPLMSLDGKEHGAQWRKVVVANVERAIAPKGHRPHLYTFEELGGVGLLRWISIRNEFSRALDPVISGINLKNATANTLLAHTGPGLEALGYLLFLRDGMTAKLAGKATLRDRLERIVADLKDCLPFENEEWVDNMCAAYNGLKHANRKEPDPIDVLNAWRESVLAVRAWVALELGFSHEKIKERLSNDHQRHAYVAVD